MAFTPSKLIEAIRASKLSEVISALDAGADLEEADVHGFSGLPLRTACFAGDLAVVRELLRRGANVNAATADGPGAPLRMALRGRHPDIVELLQAEPLAVAEAVSEPPVKQASKLLEPLVYEAPANPTPTVEPTVESTVTPTVEPVPEKNSGNMIEFTSYLANHPIEEVDISSCYGVDTNVLDMDLMRYNEEHAEPPPPPPEPESKKPGFWKMGR